MAWIHDQQGYPPDDIERVLDALARIPADAPIRAFLLLGHRAAMEDVAWFDRLLDLDPDDLPRPMAYIHLRLGLTAVLVRAIIDGEGRSIEDDLRACGRRSGETFLASSTGQAMTEVTGESMVRVKNQLQAVLSTLYKGASGQWRTINAGHSRITLEDVGCPYIQQLIWRGSLEATADRWGLKSAFVSAPPPDPNGFSLVMRWDPFELPPESGASIPVSTQMSTRSGQFRAAVHAATADFDASPGAPVRPPVNLSAFFDWLEHSTFSPAERALALNTIAAIDHANGIRALYLSSCRDLVPPSRLPAFDLILGAIPDRHMGFAPLSQGLAATLLAGRLVLPDASLGETLEEIGRHLGRTLVSSSTGHALLRVVEQDFALFLRQLNMVMTTFYNHGAVRIDTLKPGHGVVLLEQLGALPLQHHCWRGLLQAVAASIGVEVTGIQSGVSEGVAFVDMRWRDAPST